MFAHLTGTDAGKTTKTLTGLSVQRLEGWSVSILAGDRVQEAATLWNDCTRAVLPTECFPVPVFALRVINWWLILLCFITAGSRNKGTTASLCASALSSGFSSPPPLFWDLDAFTLLAEGWTQRPVASHRFPIDLCWCVQPLSASFCGWFIGYYMGMHTLLCHLPSDAI